MRIKILLLLFLFSKFLIASDIDQALVQFDSANVAYAEADFEGAQKQYEALLESNVLSDDLHYNLANTYFKTNQISLAILHYEKALKINPSNEDAAFNLKIANEKTVDKIESLPELFIYRWWQNVYQLFYMDQWAILSISLLAISLLLFIAYLIFQAIAIKKISFYGFILFLIVAGLSWVMAANQKANLQRSSHGIIMEPSLNVVSAPSSGSSQLFVLHEGTKVKIVQKNDNWVEIALPNGNKGWILNESVASI